MPLNTLRTVVLALSLGFCSSSFAQKDEALFKAAEARKAAFVVDLETLSAEA
jgi:hypothetical protein